MIFVKIERAFCLAENNLEKSEMLFHFSTLLMQVENYKGKVQLPTRGRTEFSETVGITKCDSSGIRFKDLQNRNAFGEKDVHGKIICRRFLI